MGNRGREESNLQFTKRGGWIRVQRIGDGRRESVGVIPEDNNLLRYFHRRRRESLVVSFEDSTKRFQFQLIAQDATFLFLFFFSFCVIVPLFSKY